MSPLCGFLCPLTGDHRRLEDCIKCPSKCLELPLLFALLEGTRTYMPRRYSVTEILKPPLVVHLERRVDFWTNPLSLLWATFGSSWHALVAGQAKAMAGYDRVDREYSWEDENHFEQILDFPDGPVILHGTPDQYHYPTQTLTDYKTTKFWWTAKKILDGNWGETTYHWQINIYRHYKFPQCQHQQLVMLIKDHTSRIEKEWGARPVERVDVPIMLSAIVEAEVRRRITEILAVPPRPCHLSEKWYNKDKEHYARCEDYCPCNFACEWYREYKGLKYE